MCNSISDPVDSPHNNNIQQILAPASIPVFIGDPEAFQYTSSKKQQELAGSPVSICIRQGPKSVQVGVAAGSIGSRIIHA